MVGERRYAHPARSSSSSVGSYGPATKEEIPCRYSYVRASNTYHRYGRRPSSKTSEDTSNYSSREDLIESKAVQFRRKKNTERTASLKSIADKNLGCSSSDDLLNDESDATDGFLSSGIPETDGSVFSSQEDLLETQTKCSANVTKFIRRHSSERGSHKSRTSRSGSLHVFPLEIKVTAEQPKEVYSGDIPYYVGRECNTSFSCESEDEVTYRQQTLYPGRGERRSPSPSRQCHVTFSPKSSKSFQPRGEDRIDTEEYQPLRLKVQSAIVKTVHRLIEHLGNVNNQVGVIENRCSHLQDSICTIQHDQCLLHIKLSDLESRFENRNKLDINVSDSDSGCPQCSDDVVEGKCSEKESRICKPGKECTKHASFKILKVPVFSSLLVLDDFKELLSHLRKVKTIKKSSGSRFWSIVVVVLIVGIIWDIKSAGSFYGSKVGLTLERVGLIPYVEAFGRSLRIATIQAYRWCVFNIPFYYSKGCDLAEPYLLLVWSWFEVAVAYFWAGLESIVEYIPIVKESIEKRLPGLSTSVRHYTNTVLQHGNTTVIAVKDAAMPYLLEVHNYVSTKVLIGALAPERLHEYVIGSIEYLRLLILRIHSTLMDNFEQDTENIVSKSSL